MSKAKLTFFSRRPWRGLYKYECERRRYEVWKVTFGTEPKDYEVYEYSLSSWHILHFSPSIKATAQDERRQNSKRRREAQKAVQSVGVGTRAQQVLKLQQDQGKLEHEAGARLRKRASSDSSNEKHRER